MKASDTIFQLVKAMTQNEKRFFKRYTILQGERREHHYMKVFEVIEEMKEYDEALLIQKLKERYGGEAKFLKNFSVTKKYLMDVLLKALACYDIEKDQLKFARILYKKRQYKAALKLCNKLEQEYYEANRFDDLFALINLKSQILKAHLSPKQYFEQMGLFYKWRMQLTQEMTNYYQYVELRDEITLQCNQYSCVRSQEEANVFESYLQKHLLKEGAYTISKNAEYMRLESIKHCHYALAQFEREYEVCVDTIKWWRSNKSNNYKWYNFFLATFHDVLYSAAQMNNEKTFEYYLSDFRANELKEIVKLFDEDSGLWNEVFSINLVEFVLFYCLKDYESIVNKVPEVEMELMKRWNNIFVDMRLEVVFIIAQAYFYLGNYEEAIRWNDMIERYEKTNPSLPFLCHARILNFAIHLELGNYRYLESITRSTYRFLSKNKRLYQIERHLIHFFKRVRANNIRPLLIELQEQFAAIDDPYENNFYIFFDIRIWIKQTLDGQASPNNVD